MIQLRFIGGCVPLFILAIVFDITGLILLLFGVCGDARKRGVFYGDFLIHTGALLFFASLGFWLMWYVGNIKVKEEELERRSSTAHSVKNLARKLTERLSKAHGNDAGEKASGKSSTLRNVTFGKSTYFPGQKDPETDTTCCDEPSQEKGDEDQFVCYQNKGYEDEESSVAKGEDSSQEEKQEPKPDAEEPKPDAGEPKPDAEEPKPDAEEPKPDSEFTCYQNEGYEEAESDVTKGSEQMESCDTLL